MVRSKLNSHKTSFFQIFANFQKKNRSFEHDRDISGVNIYFNSMIKTTPLITRGYFCRKRYIFLQNRLENDLFSPIMFNLQQK